MVRINETMLHKALPMPYYQSEEENGGQPALLLLEPIITKESRLKDVF